MAPKTSDLLTAIPSVSELLEKPPIRALADRFNRSVIAGGVRSFLDELRADLQRRATDANLPSIRELAERAARHVAALQQQSQRPAINATGQILDSQWISGPIAETALERAFAQGRDYVTKTTGEATADAAARMCRLAGAQAAVAVHSYAGAVWLSLSALSAGRATIVSRAELGDAEPECSLLQLISSATAILKEVGSTNRTSAADYEAAISPQTAVLLKHCAGDYCVVGETESAELEELVGLARDRELILIDALGAAPLADLPSTIPWPARSARASLAAGADLVVLRGDALVGGPACGLILGRRELVQRITEHPLFAVWKLDPLRGAALTATLDCHESSLQGEPNVPVWQLLATPVDNLRNRAERLAPQLAHSAGIASAESCATTSPLSAAHAPEHGVSSYGVALAPADGDVQALEFRLLRLAPTAVVGRVEHDRLMLDLRTVFPRQDQLLVEAIVGGPQPTETGA